MSSEDKVLAAISYLGPLSILSFFVGKTPFVKFHAKQGIVLFLVVVVIRIALSVLTMVFGWNYGYGYGMMGWGMMGGGFIGSALSVAIFIAVIAGIIKAMSGEQWHMPFIGDLAQKF